MPRKPKRERPKTRQDRARVHEINRLLRTRGGLTPEYRASLEAEKDRLAPVIQVGSLSQKASELVSADFSGTPDSPAIKADDARAALARKLDAAKKAFESQLSAKVLNISDALCVIAEQHAKFTYEVWSGRSDWENLPHSDRAAIVTCQLRVWRKQPLFERPTWGEAAWAYFMGLTAVEKLRLSGEFAKLTPEQRANIFKQTGVVKRAVQVMEDKYFTEPQGSTSDGQSITPSQLPEPLLTEETTPLLDPIAAASANLAARSALLLQSDSWLSRLAEHSPEMRTRIIAGLSQELLRAGCVGGDFSARLYNELRPRAVGAFPERKF